MALESLFGSEGETGEIAYRLGHRIVVRAGALRFSRPFKTRRLAESPAPGPATINREVAVLAHAFTLGRRFGKLTVAFDVAGLRLAEAPARSGFFERDLHDAFVRALPDYAQPVAIAGYDTGWRINEPLSRQWRHLDLEAGVRGPGETEERGRPQEGRRATL